MRFQIAFVISCILLCAGCTDDRMKGDDSFAKGDLQEAIIYYSSYLQKNPGDCEVLLSRGVAYQTLGSYTLAISDFSKAIDTKACKLQTRIHCHLKRGFCLDSLEEFKYARNDFNIAKQWYPNNEDLFISSGNANFLSNDYRTAANDYTHLLSFKTLRVSRALIYVYRYDCFYQMDSLKDALKDIEAAIKLEPDNGDHYCSRFYLNLNLDNFEAATKDLEIIRHIESVSHFFSTYKASLLFYEGKYKEAVGYFSDYISKFPDNCSGSLLDRSRCYFYLKEYNKQIADLDVLIASDSTNSDYYNKKGWSYLFLKENEKALTALNKSIELDTKNIDAYDSRGCARYLTGDFTGALADFNTVLEKDENYSNSRFYRGLCFIHFGEKAEACQDLKLAKKLGDYTVFDGVETVEQALKKSCK